MAWFFSKPETVTPEFVLVAEPATEDSAIVETPFDGCAWCGTGDGMCAEHQAQMFAQSAERVAEKRGRRS